MLETVNGTKVGSTGGTMVLYPFVDRFLRARWNFGPELRREREGACKKEVLEILCRPKISPHGKSFGIAIAQKLYDSAPQLLAVQKFGLDFQTDSTEDTCAAY